MYKKVLTAARVITALAILQLLIVALIIVLAPMSETTKLVVMLCSTAVTVACAFYAVYLEHSVGYYKCMNCHHTQVPTYMQTLTAPHFGTTRFLKCPRCKCRTWHRKTPNFSK